MNESINDSLPRWTCFHVRIYTRWKKIEWMDHVGMDSIASQEPGAFAKYIKLYKNTICGRHPIAVYLSALKESKESGVEQVQIHFVKYAQSSQVKYDHESSVSYASAVIRKV
jgi:Predicted dioxygenase